MKKGHLANRIFKIIEWNCKGMSHDTFLSQARHLNHLHFPDILIILIITETRVSVNMGGL